MTEVTAPVTSVGWQITLCDPIDKWRPIVLRWISRRTYAPLLPLQEEINTNCKTTVFITRFTPIDLPLYVIHRYYFDLPRQQWSLLNRFHMEQGHCGACRRKWRLTDADLCPCGEDPDDVPQCQILFPDKTEWWLISAILCGWRRCFVADQLWFMTRIREEEDCERVMQHA